MADRELLTFATTSYGGLQGLRMVPMGAMLVLWALLETVWLKSNLRDAAKLLSVIAAIALFFHFGKQYKSIFGRVEPVGSPVRSALCGLALLGLYLASHYIDEQKPPISLTGLLYAGFYAVCYWGSARRRSYCLSIAMAFLVLACIPLTPLASADQLFLRPATIGNVAFGCSVVIVGLLDHVLLRRMLTVPARMGDV